MPEQNPEPQTSPDSNDESFATLLRSYEQQRAGALEDSGKRIHARVIAVTADQAILDIGYKVEGVLNLATLGNAAAAIKPGDALTVSVKGRNAEGYYEVVSQKIAQPRDWSSFEQAFEQKLTIPGTVTGVVKGGLTVDVGVRAFMPASRSGTREASGLETLVGQEILCRIIKLEALSEDVVVDRRVVLEEEASRSREKRLGEIQPGDIVTGTVRSLMDYGAFLDLGSVDALLHIGDIAWARVEKPQDVLTVGQSLEVKVLSVDTAKRRLSVGLKQLQPEPWQTAADRYKVGDRVRGTVTRLADFGAFVQLEPGIEGLVHLSEMSWAKKVHKPGDLLHIGDAVDTVILSIQPGEKRISLGIKQTHADPFVEVAKQYPVGSVVNGTVLSFTRFGAFVRIAEGVEGMIHISEIDAERRLQHPQDVLHAGQQVRTEVIDVDPERRQIRLSMKRLIPTSLDEYLAEHHENDVVSARILEISGPVARVELGEGIFAQCDLPAADPVETAPPGGQNGNLSSLTSLLQAKWKGASPARALRPAVPAEGQVRSFRLARLDREKKQIHVALLD